MVCGEIRPKWLQNDLVDLQLSECRGNIQLLIRRSDAGVWTGGVSNFWTWSFGTLNPNVAKDYQALSESTSTSINIDGTHFSSLCVLSYNGIDWIPWYRHVTIVDPPYTVTQVSNSEFYASGGG